jgi:protoporphyrinogen oxidase
LKIFVHSYKTNSASLIESFVYPKRGPGQLWETMAERVTELGGSIMYNARVAGVMFANNTITSVTVEYGGATETVPCDYLFSSMPVKDLVAAMGSSVPPSVQKIAAALPYRDFITVGLLVKKLKLKNKTRLATVSNIVPDCWIYIQERDVKIGRLQIFNNWSPYMVADLENTVWVGLEYFCNEDDALWSMSREEFIAFAIDELVKINIIDKDDVLDAVQVKIKKTYPAYFGAYSEFGTIRTFLDGIANLYCIGRNGQHRYNNMDHSMLTAIEAVNVLKSGGANKAAVWNVNTEEEYHEEK